MSGPNERISDADWPQWVVDALNLDEFDPDADVATLRSRLEAMGLEVLEMGEEWSSVPKDEPRFLAAVADPQHPDTPVRLHWSYSGYAAALARAGAGVLEARDDT